jgi:hypothetical protein
LKSLLCLIYAQAVGPFKVTKAIRVFISFKADKPTGAFAKHRSSVNFNLRFPVAESEFNDIVKQRLFVYSITKTV